jgi:hypothetical protein
MGEESALVVIDYMEKYLKVPSTTWPVLLFNHRSYSRWAATEIIELLMDNPFESEITLVESFMMKMERLERVNPWTSRRFIFAIAKDAAEDILHIFERGQYE